MERPMQAHGLTLFERFLEDFLTLAGWAMVAFAIVAGVFGDFFGASGFGGGLVVAATFIGGVVLILGSGGIRQNRAALELAQALLAGSAIGWLAVGAWSLTVPALVAGVLLGVLFGLSAYLRRLAIYARFRPRALGLRQFETMVAIADAMIEGEGDEVMNAIQVAVNVDHALARLETPLKKDISLVLHIVEWVLPLRILRPFAFSALGSNERRRAVEAVVGSKGIFRDVARFLKMLSCIGYYGTPEGMRSTGYIPFEERERAIGADQSPAHYPEPLPLEARP